MDSSGGLRLERLPGEEPWLQIAVAAALLARMRPNFQLFCEVTESDAAEAEGKAAEVFSNLLQLVWEYAGGTNTGIDFGKQQEKLEAITPDPAAYDMYGVWPALDATVALAALLGACERFDGEEIRSIQELSRATIDGFIDASGDDPEGHALYEQEREFLRQVLQAASTPGSRREVVGSIRAVLAHWPESNIGLSLD